jgi:hypothetical protein
MVIFLHTYSVSHVLGMSYITYVGLRTMKSRYLRPRVDLSIFQTTQDLCASYVSLRLDVFRRRFSDFCSSRATYPKNLSPAKRENAAFR